MNFKYPLFSSLVLSIILSGSAFAKKPEGKGKHHYQGSEKEYRKNSNKQSDEFSSRGRDRAEERHQYKKSKKQKKNKEKSRDKSYEREHDRHEYRRNDDYERKRDGNEYFRKDESYRDRDNRELDRYERQRYKERYQNDPVGIIVDETADTVRSKVNQVHRKAIDSIDNKTRALSGNSNQTESVRENKPWWSIFGGE